MLSNMERRARARDQQDVAETHFARGPLTASELAAAMPCPVQYARSLIRSLISRKVIAIISPRGAAGQTVYALQKPGLHSTVHTVANGEVNPPKRSLAQQIPVQFDLHRALFGGL